MSDGTLMEFTDSNFNDEVISGALPVIVDFWAEWCGPCKMLTPIIKEMAEAFDGKVKIGKLNVDDNPQTAAKYGIVSIPSLLFVHDGKVIDQHTGLLAAAPLKEKINKAFNL
jgi:thioredoxin 1